MGVVCIVLASVAPGCSARRGGGRALTASDCISVGSDDGIQALIDANPPGTAFCIAPGTHLLRAPLAPKPGDRFTGSPGATISGAKRIRKWTRRGHTWVARGQKQGPTIETMSGVSRREHLHAASAFADDVFYDDMLLKRVLSRKRLAKGPRRFYFDYKAEEIWINVRPRGHSVEAAISRGLFTGSPHVGGVIIEGVMVEKAAGFGINSQGGPEWIVRNNDIRLNHTYGVKVGEGGEVGGNHVHHNGQYGVSAGDGTNILIEGNEIDHNNTAGYAVAEGYWDSGGTKFVRSDGLTLLGNNVHDNHGDGLWVDIDNSNVTIVGNTVTENDRNGIFYEVSHAGTIEGNVVANNDDVAIYVLDSNDVDVHENVVSVSPTDKEADGIRIHQDDRVAKGYITQNVTVHNNTVRMCTGLTGGSRYRDGTAIFDSRNNHFEGNSYIVPNLDGRFWTWRDATLNMDQWRAYGQDVVGSFQEGTCQ